MFICGMRLTYATVVMQPAFVRRYGLDLRLGARRTHDKSLAHRQDASGMRTETVHALRDTGQPNYRRRLFCGR